MIDFMTELGCRFYSELRLCSFLFYFFLVMEEKDVTYEIWLYIRVAFEQIFH